MRLVNHCHVVAVLYASIVWASSSVVCGFTGHQSYTRPHNHGQTKDGGSVSSTTTSTTSLRARGLFVPNLPNPFADLQPSDNNNIFFGKGSGENDKPFDPSPEGLIRQAKKVLSADLGLLDPSLLDDKDFEWLGPYVDRPLDKTDYLAAGRFFAIPNAFPDLNFRAHDFRVDDNDGDSSSAVATVRMTCRTTGTMRGELRLRDETLPPTGNIMSCPPEALSMTFDLESGKVVKLRSGFCMDRVVGNTDGTTGVIAAAMTAGKPISNWEVYPPLTVLQRIFGRPEAPIEDVKNFLAPFPETVMIQLAKGILTSNMAEDDPSLLSDDFVFSTPSVGPIGKKDFLAKFAPEEFNGVQPRFSNYRVDPYDPNRVWVDVAPKGPGYIGSPQAMSFAFDPDGFCTRITSWYVMDPTVGNGGGLGGPEGFKFAQSSANELAARPLPRILGRIKVDFLDLFKPDGKKRETAPMIKMTPPVAAAQKRATSTATSKPRPTPVRRPSATTSAAASASSSGGSSERERLPIPLQKLTKAFGTINLLEMQRESAAQRKTQREKAASTTAKKRGAPTMGVAGGSAFKDQLAKRKETLMTQAKALQAKQKETNAALKKQQEEVAARKKQQAAAALKRQQEQAEQKRKQQQEAAQKKQAAAAAAARKRRQEEAAAAAAEQRRKQQLEQQKEAQQRASEEKSRRAAQAQAQANQRAAMEAKQQEQARQKAAQAAQKQEDARRRQAEVARRQEAQAKTEAERLATQQRRQEEAARKAADAEAKRIAQEKARQEQVLAQKAAAEKKQRELAERKQAELETKRKLAREKALKEQRLAQQREMERQRNERIEAAKRKQEERARFATQAKKEETALKALSKSPIVGTIRLLGLGGSEDQDDDVDIKPAPLRKKVAAKKAPGGVPTLSRWRRNLDGSVSGLVSGSRNFDNGERITTSPIKSGNLASGEVVVTGSGSKYFLE